MPKKLGRTKRYADRVITFHRGEPKRLRQGFEVWPTWTRGRMEWECVVVDAHAGVARCFLGDTPIEALAHALGSRDAEVRAAIRDMRKP